MSRIHVFIGTYTMDSDSDGIFRASLNLDTGHLDDLQCVATIDNPSFLCKSADGTTLFAVSETDRFDGKPTGGVASFAILDDPTTLKPVSQISSGGRAPCYISCLNNHLLVANYVEGTVASFAIRETGELDGALSVVQHSGSGPSRDRQEGPHAHSISPIPDSDFALAADLGTDEIITYRLSESGILEHTSVVPCEPGSGPRHMAFHPNRPWLFVLNELNNTLALYRYEKTDGTISPVTSLSTVPDDFTGDSISADIHCSADGRFVYCTNRGHDSIAVFAFNAADETLDRIQVIRCGGDHPRNFAITPNGRFLLCANQNTNSIVTFTIDHESGILSETGISADVPMPVCLCL